MASLSAFDKQQLKWFSKNVTIIPMYVRMYMYVCMYGCMYAYVCIYVYAILYINSLKA